MTGFTRPPSASRRSDDVIVPRPSLWRRALDRLADQFGPIDDPDPVDPWLCAACGQTWPDHHGGDGCGHFTSPLDGSRHVV